MKALATFLILALLLGGGGWWAYNEGHLDGLIGEKKAEEGTGQVASEPDTSQPSAPSEKKSSAPAVAAKKEEVDPIALLYPMPDFPSLAKVTGDWKTIPTSVFPRPIEATAPIPFEMRKNGKVFGSTTKPVGTKLVAIGQKDGKLVVAAAADSKAQSFADIDSTNLKPTLTGLYEDWVKRRTNAVLAQREAERSRIAQAKASGGGQAYVAERPVASPGSDPRFAPMVAAIKSGDWPELKMDNIRGWRWVGKEGGYDVGIVQYPAQTMFGSFDTEAKAMIQNGKVQRWLYTGSGEEVPRH